MTDKFSGAASPPVVHDNLRDNIGQIIADYVAEHTNPLGRVGIDWLSSRDIDPLADRIAQIVAQQAAAKAPAAQAVDALPAFSISRFSDTKQRGVLILFDRRLSDREIDTVRAALAPPLASTPEASQQADDEWDRNAERLTREMGIGGGRINPDATSIDDLFIDDEDDKQAAAVAAPTDKEIEDKVFALGIQSYAFTDDPAGYCTLVRSFARPGTAGAATTSEDARDAARYRYMRNEAWGCGKQGYSDVHVCQFGPGVLKSAITELAEEALDAAVDAAMRATQQEGGK